MKRRCPPDLPGDGRGPKRRQDHSLSFKVEIITGRDLGANHCRWGDLSRSPSVNVCSFGALATRPSVRPVFQNLLSWSRAVFSVRRVRVRGKSWRLTRQKINHHCDKTVARPTSCVTSDALRGLRNLKTQAQSLLVNDHAAGSTLRGGLGWPQCGWGGLPASSRVRRRVMMATVAHHTMAW